MRRKPLHSASVSPRGLLIAARFWGGLVALIFAACAAPGDEQPADATAWITLEELATSLPPTPIVVGFDVDDTLLFSSPGFHYGFTNIHGTGGSNRFGENPIRSAEFWELMNRELDVYSIPKQSARDLIDMHRARGDQIWFVTARPPSTDEGLSALLARTFGLEHPHPVVFTALGSKVPALEEHGIVLFYGDSDGDVEDAQAAGARAIRVLRPALSTNPGSTRPGELGEEVLVESDR